MRNIDHNNYEEWLFEYFEGSLSGEEKNLVLEFIQRDPLYQEEFNYWEKTYIREPLPSKLKIEGALLRNQTYSKYRTYLYSVVILLFSGIASFLYFNEKDEETKSSLNQQAIEKPTILTSQKKIGQEKTIKEKTVRTFENARVKTEPLASLPIVENKIMKDSALEKVETAGETGLQLPQEDSLLTMDENKITDSTLQIQSNLAVVPLTKKERRERRRYLEKLKEKERIKQLRKGKLPYLVPLDPNTF